MRSPADQAGDDMGSGADSSIREAAIGCPKTLSAKDKNSTIEKEKYYKRSNQYLKPTPPKNADVVGSVSTNLVQIFLSA